MRFHRTLRVGVVALAAVGVAAPLSACGSDDDGGAEADTPRIGVFLAAAGNSYAQAHLEGARAAAEEFGAEIQEFDGKFDATTQFAQVQDAIASGRYDGFVVSANDGNALQPVLRQAGEEEIPYVCILAPCGEDFDTLEPQAEGQLAHVGKSFPGGGEQIGEMVVDACGDKDPCKVAYIPGLVDLPLETARTDAFVSVIEEHPNIELTLTRQGEYLAETALPIAQDVLQADSDTDVIASSGDQMIVGAEKAVNARDLTGEIALVGNGGNQLAIDAVKEGRWYGTAVGLPYTEGFEATELVIKAIDGEEDLPTSIDTDTLPDAVGGVVTEENVDEFEPQFKN